MNATIQFETGATNAASNNLVLSVLSDGQAYNERLQTAKRLLQGMYPVRSFRDITNAEACKQRLQGCKFKAKEIAEAAEIVSKESIQDAIELIRYKWEEQNKPCITANCRRWFDKINGSSHFSVSLFIAGNVINIPMQYGYGSYWQYEVINLLEKFRFIPKLSAYENGNKNYGYMSDYERNNIVKWEDQGYMNKNKMFNGVILL